MTSLRAMPFGRVLRGLSGPVLVVVLLGVAAPGLTGCSTVQEGYTRLVTSLGSHGQTGQASGDETPGDLAPSSTPINKPAPQENASAMRTEVTPTKLRIVGTLLTDKATVAPVSQTAGRDSFAVELTTAGGQTPPAPSN